MNLPPEPPARHEARLSFWDTVSVIVGIVVGVSIFRAPSAVFGSMAGPGQALAVWVLGGMLTLIGALCYAELAAAYPRLGGDYIYLTRGYGAPVGFLFGWVQLTAIFPGSAGAMAFVFADYAIRLWNWSPDAGAWIAPAVVIVITIVNLFGLKSSSRAQNLLTSAKLLGVFVIVVAGLASDVEAPAETAVERTSSNWGLALIFTLYSFGGWNDSVFVAAEVRDAPRNMPKALILGTLGITTIYLLVNASYLWVLGFDGVRESSTPAADVLQAVFGNWGSRGMSVLVMISALGAVNGMVFTSSRVTSSLGADHRIFALLGRWDPRLSSPVWALAAQATVSLTMIYAVGTQAGHDLLDRTLVAVGTTPIPWDRFGNGFEALVTATAPVFWLFMLLTTVSVFVLRVRDKDRERPFKTPLFPVVPTIYCLVCGYMLYSSLAYAGKLALLGIIPLACGVPMYVLQRYWIGGRPKPS